jgi:hypothetical protein
MADMVLLGISVTARNVCYMHGDMIEAMKAGTGA